MTVICKIGKDLEPAYPAVRKLAFERHVWRSALLDCVVYPILRNLR
jgi:hypothetical protein